MNEQLKAILENAIKEEEYFHNFYANLAEKTTDEEIKESLNMLSEQELMHKERLESLKIENVIPDKIDAIDIADELGLPPIEEFLDMQTMFEFALKQEVAAKTLYRQLADAVEEPEAKRLLIILSEEESKHEQILAQELEKMR